MQYMQSHINGFPILSKSNRHERSSPNFRCQKLSHSSFNCTSINHFLQRKVALRLGLVENGFETQEILRDERKGQGGEKTVPKQREGNMDGREGVIRLRQVKHISSQVPRNVQEGF